MDHLEIWHVLGMVSIRPAGDVQGKVNFALRTSLILHLVDIADGLSKFFEDSDHLRLSVWGGRTLPFQGSTSTGGTLVSVLHVCASQSKMRLM